MGTPLTMNDLQAFRKDYQMLRAVPALDYRHDGNTQDALSKTMKQNRRQEKIEALGPPLDILTRNMDVDALQALRADYQELRAIPALDFVPKRVSPSKWLLQDGFDESVKGVEPESLGPPLPIFAAILEDIRAPGFSATLEEVVSALKDSTSRRGEHIQFGSKASWGDELSSQSSASDWRARSRPLTVGSLPVEYEDLQALRKDYQELRAVPGLDFQPQAMPDSCEMADPSLAMLPRSMRQHRKESSDLQGLGPPLDIVSANADMEAIQAFRANYQNLRACPALDFIPRHVRPSKWLVESTTSDDGVSLARVANSVEPKTLGPPLEFFTEQWLSAA
jgi:hypothetical protein